MAKVIIPIGGGYYLDESLPISAQRLINWFPAIPQTAGAQTAIYNTPGQSDFTSLGGINRGQHIMDEVNYAVNGNVLFKVNEDKTSASLGSIEGLGMVSMADNGSKLAVVVPGGKSYFYDGSALTQITDTDFITADTVSFKDGYFIFTASDGSVFFNSALNDPSNYRSLDTGTAEIDPDRIVSSIVIHNELFILGTRTIEIFQNIGGADFPFQRIPGANIQKGSHATFGVVGLDETFAFVGGGKDEKSGIYQISDSSRVIKISTPAIDLAIQKFSKDEISECVAMTYFDRGSQIAIWTFVSDKIPSKTFAYNATTTRLSGIPIWFEFQSGVSDNRWNVNSISVAYGKVLAGTTDAKIVELDHDVYTDSGEQIMRQLTTRALSNQDSPFFMPTIKLLMEAGVGLTTGQGSDPKVGMQISDDGKVFGNMRQRSIGKIGRFEQQTQWRRNGRTSMQRFHRFTITDPIKPIIRGLQAVAQPSGPES